MELKSGHIVEQGLTDPVLDDPQHAYRQIIGNLGTASMTTAIHNMSDAGCLIAVVGASGVGKDSVIDGLLSSSATLKRAKRVITRDPQLPSEDFYPLNTAQFDRAVTDGDFCLHWRAHDLSYGIPKHVLSQVQNGDYVIANLSRSVLLQAAEQFPNLFVLHLSAQPATLAKRLITRGRETESEVVARLARSTYPLPDGLNIEEVRNDSDLQETVQTVIQRLKKRGIYPRKRE